MIFVFFEILILGLGIAFILKQGFNAIVKGLESIDEKLAKNEEKFNKKQDK